MAPDFGRLLGSGKEAEVFEYGDLALKLYRQGASKRSAFREAAALAIVEETGIPAPKVQRVGQFDGRWGLVMTKAEGVSFGNAMAGSADQQRVATFARMHRQIHRHSGNGLPSLIDRLAANIKRTDILDDDRRQKLLAELTTLPTGNQLCHGDFHPWNVIGSVTQAMVVDWLDATSGPGAADVCRSFVLMDHVSPALALDYVNAYSLESGLPLDEIWRWRPVVAAARLAEGVPNETQRLMAMAGAHS